MRVLLDDSEVEWVVNSLSELGVKIGGQFFWLYKGRSLVYEKGLNEDNDTPILWRPVGKREFGECCHPLHLKTLPDIYTDGEGWQPLPTTQKSEYKEPTA